MSKIESLGVPEVNRVPVNPIGTRSLPGPQSPNIRFYGRKLAYRDELTQIYGDWLSQYNWNLFVTLTFRDICPEMKAKGFTYISRAYAVRQWRKLLKALKKVEHRAPYWVRVTESSEWRDAPHFHAVLGGITRVEPYRVEQLWYKQCGLAKVERYDPELGGAWYLSADHEALEFSKNLPSSGGSL